MRKIIRCAIAAIIISLIIPLYCFGKQDKSQPFKLTGKIVAPLYKARMNVLYTEKNNSQAVCNFIINERTQIIGNLQVGATVNVTFRVRRRRGYASKRLALVIEVKGDAPQGATLSAPK
jgi:hypothetical protein